MSPLLWGAVDDALAITRIEALIRKHVNALTGRDDPEYEVIVERGQAHLVLARLAISRQALLVVGTHMHHGLGHALLRDVTERVIERARGPVLVTRPQIGSDRILVAVDRPFNASAALDAAIEEARSSSALLTAFHCLNVGFMTTLAADLFNGGAYAARPMGQRPPLSEVRQALRVELRRRQIDADLYVVEGDARELISEVATRVKADLIVMGTAHRPAPTPQITTSVLRHADCSVLVVDEQALTASSSVHTRAGSGKPSSAP